MNSLKCGNEKPGSMDVVFVVFEARTSEMNNDCRIYTERHIKIPTPTLRHFQLRFQI